MGHCRTTWLCNPSQSLSKSRGVSFGSRFRRGYYKSDRFEKVTERVKEITDSERCLATSLDIPCCRHLSRDQFVFQRSEAMVYIRRLQIQQSMPMPI
ncbi:hypothetical protein PoB_005135000 [Plakobranchus ocellatus]|uniref:Uncharacterized protein n=1 Tax=Plakobranchus ocellatus TaxID=259542 RepID=A0AAV4BZS5_9GAST|nr:hypothetical protein PoB_005135000 [Plakobranchus ocellatus]